MVRFRPLVREGERMLSRRSLVLVSVLATVALMGAACSKKTTTTTQAVGSPTGPVVTATASATPANVKVCINRYVTFDVLDQALNGIQQQLTNDGYIENQNLTYDIQNPEADTAT